MLLIVARRARPVLKSQQAFLSYYETVGDIERDKKALDAARDAMKGRGDGRISKADAVKIAVRSWTAPARRPAVISSNKALAPLRPRSRTGTV
jgi:hypothetical protein